MDRLELTEVDRIMQASKNDICSLPPLTMAVTTTYGNVADNTQNSVFVQREIEEFTTEFTAGKDLADPEDGLITNRAHDQRQTNLCASYAGTSTLRAAAKRFLVEKGNPLQPISDDLEAAQGRV